MHDLATHGQVSQCQKEEITSVSEAAKPKTFEEAGEKAKETKDASHIGRWLLDNAAKGDVIKTEDGGYEVTGVKTKKDGTKEVVLTPFETLEDGSRDYNNPGIKLITEAGIKNASDVFEQSYTDKNGHRVTVKSIYEPAKPEAIKEGATQTPVTDESQVKKGRGRQAEKEKEVLTTVAEAPVEKSAGAAAETVKRINTLSEYESQGYNVVRLRELKKAMLEDPVRAQAAFDMYDYARKKWGKLGEDMEKTPLGSVMQFFYGEAKSVPEFIKSQIEANKSDIASSRKYIDSLGKSKGDVASRKMGEESIAKREAEIKDYEKDLNEIEAKSEPISKTEVSENDITLEKPAGAAAEFEIDDPVIFTKKDGTKKAGVWGGYSGGSRAVIWDGKKKHLVEVSDVRHVGEKAAEKPSLSEIKSDVIEKAAEAVPQAKKEGVPLKVQKDDLLGQIQKAIDVVVGDQKEHYEAMKGNGVGGILADSAFGSDANIALRLKEAGFNVSKEGGHIQFDVEGDGTFNLLIRGLDMAKDEVQKHWPTSNAKPVGIRTGNRMPSQKPIGKYSTRAEAEQSKSDALENLETAKKSGNKAAIETFQKQAELESQEYKDALSGQKSLEDQIKRAEEAKKEGKIQSIYEIEAILELPEKKKEAARFEGKPEPDTKPDYEFAKTHLKRLWDEATKEFTDYTAEYRKKDGTLKSSIPTKVEFRISRMRDNIEELQKRYHEIEKLAKPFNLESENKKAVSEGFSDLTHKINAIRKANGITDARKNIQDFTPEEISKAVERKSDAMRLRSKKIDGIGMHVDFGITKTLYNSALELAAKQVESGTKVGKAIQNAIRFIDEHFKGREWNRAAFARHLNDRYKIKVGGREVEVQRDDSKQAAQVVNGFYSPLEQGILDAKVEKTTGKDWAKRLKGATEGDEIRFTGLDKFLEENADKSLTKKEVQDFLKENRIEVVEVVKGDFDRGKLRVEQTASGNWDIYYDKERVTTVDKLDAKTEEEAIDVGESMFDYEEPITKYHQYQLPGAKSDYKEILVTLPVDASMGSKPRQLGGQTFRSSHFDEPNILAHLRMNTRTAADGKKTLFIEEMQSDWGQQGKRKGFGESISVTTKDGIVKGRFDNRLDAEKFIKDSGRNDLQIIEEPYRQGVPEAPFVTQTPSWVKLGWKVALKEAVKQGAERIAWTTGEQQNARYDLSKQVDEILYFPTLKEGVWDVSAAKNDKQIWSEHADAKRIEQVLGKDIADKITNGDGELLEKDSNRNREDKYPVKALRGVDLQVGGKGMIGFYGSPKEGKTGIVGSVAESLTGQKAKETKIEINESKSHTGDTETLERAGKTANGDPIYESESGHYAIGIGEDLNGRPDHYDVFVDNKKVGSAITLEDANQLLNDNLFSSKGTSAQHSIDITPEIKSAVEKGLPLFKGLSKTEVSKAKLDAAATKLSNKLRGGLQSGGLNALPEFVEYVKAFIEHTSNKVEDFIKHWKEAFPKSEFSDKELTDAFNEVKGEKVESFEREQGKKSLESRVYEGETPEEIKSAVEKHGLNYDVEGHPEAESKANAFIEEVGIDNAIQSVRKHEVEGGSATYVWAKAIDNLHKEYLTEKNPAKKAELLKKESSLIDEFGTRMRRQGQSISALQAAYQTSELGYKLGAILNRAKEAIGDKEVPEDVMSRLEELTTKLDDATKKLAELEKRRSEEPPVEIIKEPVPRRRASLSAEKTIRKSELGKKYRGVLNDITRIITLLGEKDFREYASLVLEEAAGDFKAFSKEMINNVGKGIREYLPKLYKDLGGKENPQMESIQRQLKRSIDEYERRIREKDFSTKKGKEKPTLDEETFNMLVQKNRLKEEIDTEIERLRLKERTNMEKLQEGFVDVVNLPKSLMASADLSAPLRQGAILSFRHPVIAARATKEMMRQAFSEKKQQMWLTRLKSTPEYYDIKKSGLYLAEPTAKLTAKEEQFISNIAHHIPIWGRIVKGSERAYTGYLNKLRVDTFSAFHDALLRDGFKGEKLDKELKAYADFVNNASGRGSLGKFEESAPLLNATFFSPRYVVSRFNLINPVKYARMTPRARMEAMKTMGAYIGVGLTTLAIAKAGGADVEDDPRSSDFGKIRVGNTRYDIWAGMSQLSVLLTRLATGQTKSISGDVKNLGEGYKATTRGDIMLRFLRSKAGPAASTATDFLVGKDFNGNDVTVSNEVMKNVLPLWSSDIYKIAHDPKGGAGSAAAAGTASFFGVGVQNYSPKNKKQ